MAPSSRFTPVCRFARRLRLELAAVLAAAILPCGPLRAADGEPLTHGLAAFDVAGDLTDFVYAVDVAPNGKIVLVGTVAWPGGVSGIGVARFLPSGPLDATFNGGGRAWFMIDSQSFGAAVHVMADGKILVGGTVEGASGNRDFLVVRLLADGSFDPAFGSNGNQSVGFDVGGNLDDFLTALTVDSSGRILLVGAAEVGTPGSGRQEFAVARLLNNGTLDATFATLGRRTLGGFDPSGVSFDAGRAVVIDPQGRIVVAGSTAGGDTPQYDLGLVRLLPDGALDISFGSGGYRAQGIDQGGWLHDHAFGVAIQGDGKIVVAGSAALANEHQSWLVARFDSAGSLDPTFGSGTGWVVGKFDCGGNPSCAYDDEALGLALQRDGKIVIAGYGRGSHAPSPDNTDFGAARLLASGALDPTFGDGDGTLTYDFNRGTGAHHDFGMALAVAPDGRFVVAGHAEWNAADTDFAWVRLDNAFIFDDGFELGSAAAWADPMP